MVIFNLWPEGEASCSGVTVARNLSCQIFHFPLQSLQLHLSAFGINIAFLIFPGVVYENLFLSTYEVIVEYDGVEVGRHRLDLLVGETIVIELKAIKNLEDVHFAIVKSYLKSWGKKHAGLLLNFAKVTLEVKRVIYD